MHSPAVITLGFFDGIARSAWAYPALEVVHVVGVALLFGNLVVLELRLWGLGRDLPLQGLARLALPLAGAGFVLISVSGLLMFATNAAELLTNRSFVLKLGLIGLAGLNAALFHIRDGLQKADGWARAQTALSMGLWLGVIICGRWIAYQ